MTLATFLILILSLACVEALYIVWARHGISRALTRHRAPSGKLSVTAGGFIFLPAAIFASLIGDTNVLEWGLIATATALFILSLADDLYNLRVWPRLSLQVAASLFSGWLICGGDILAILLTAALLLLLMNSCNFMDGISGMLGLWTVITLPALLIAFSVFDLPVAQWFSDVILSLLAAALTFCFFNVVRVDEVFSGDVGAIIIGYFTGLAIATLILLTFDLVWLVFGAVFIVDTLVTLIRRLWSGENVFHPHRKHLYQQLVYRSGKSHLKVSLIYALTQAAINTATFLIPRDYHMLWLAGVYILLTATVLSMQSFKEPGR